jgi:hypothetical protein
VDFGFGAGEEALDVLTVAEDGERGAGGGRRVAVGDCRPPEAVGAGRN